MIYPSQTRHLCLEMAFKSGRSHALDSSPIIEKVPNLDAPAGLDAATTLPPPLSKRLQAPVMAPRLRNVGLYITVPKIDSSLEVASDSATRVEPSRPRRNTDGTQRRSTMDVNKTTKGTKRRSTMEVAFHCHSVCCGTLSK